MTPESPGPVTFEHTCGARAREFDCKGCFPPPTHDEAEQIALAYIDKAFNKPEKPGRRIRHSIPANPGEDTDIRLMAYIKHWRSVETAGFVPQQQLVEAQAKRRSAELGLELFQQSAAVVEERNAALTEQLAAAETLASQLRSERDSAETNFAKSCRQLENERATRRRLEQQRAAMVKVLELYQECGVGYCEFHQGKEEEYARECSTCDSIDRLRAAKVELVELDRATPAAPAEPAQPGDKCGNCLKCVGAYEQMTRGRMIVCPTCGNKRCPKATYHGHLCTGSNEPGQPGSDYALAVAQPAQPDSKVAQAVEGDTYEDGFVAGLNHAAAIVTDEASYRERRDRLRSQPSPTREAKDSSTSGGSTREDEQCNRHAEEDADSISGVEVSKERDALFPPEAAGPVSLCGKCGAFICVCGRVNPSGTPIAAPPGAPEEHREVSKASTGDAAGATWIPALHETVRFKGIQQTYTVRSVDLGDMTACVLCDDGNGRGGWWPIKELEPAPAAKAEQAAGREKAFKVGDVVQWLPSGREFRIEPDQLEVVRSNPHNYRHVAKKKKPAPSPAAERAPCGCALSPLPHRADCPLHKKAAADAPVMMSQMLAALRSLSLHWSDQLAEELEKQAGVKP